MKTVLTSIFLTIFSLSVISQKAGPLMGSISLTQPTCNGYFDGEITITPSGGLPPYSYIWSNGDTTQTISNINAGNYSVLVTDSYGQAMGGTITLTEPDPIIIEGVSTNTPINTSNGVVDITNVYNTVGNYTWVWSSNNGQVMNQSSLDQTNLSPGYYKIYLTDENGCMGFAYFEIKSFIKPINNPGFILNGLSNNTSAIQLNDSNTTLYPNPSNGDITINSEEKIKQLKVVNINSGEETNINTDGLNEININNLKSGNYILYVTKDNGLETKTITVL